MSILGKFKQKFSLMASVSEVPYLSGDIMSLCSCHRLVLYIARFTPKNVNITSNLGAILCVSHLISMA